MTEHFHFDFHIHSSYSFDSLSSPQKILKFAHKRGLNGISITDHDTIKGSIVAKSIKQDKVSVIVGSEISTDCGDLIGLFLTEQIVSRQFEEVIDEIKDQGGIVVFPHPYRRKIIPVHEQICRLDVIEGINGRCSKKENINGEILSKRTGKQMIAGSDAHFLWEIGRVFTCCPYINCSNTDEIRRVLLKGELKPYNKDLNQIIRYSSQLVNFGIKKIRKL